MVGGPVTIEDPRSTVLAYSNLADHEVDEGRRATILGHRVPEEWIRRQQDDGVFRKLFREPGVIRHHYAEFGLKPRSATAIRAGDEILGSIWVQEGERPLDAESESALEEAGRIAALHLLRHRSSADLERGRRAELLRAASRTASRPTPSHRFWQLTPGSPLTVVALELLAPDASDSAADRGDGRSGRQHGDALLRVVPAPGGGGGDWRGCVRVGAHGDGDDRSRLTALAAGMCERLAEALRVHVQAGVGRTVATIAELLTSRREADRVLRALSASPAPGPVATADTLRSVVVLQYLQEHAAGEPTLQSGKIDVLAEHDNTRGTEYVATLRASSTRWVTCRPRLRRKACTRTRSATACAGSRRPLTLISTIRSSA